MSKKVHKSIVDSYGLSYVEHGREEIICNSIKLIKQQLVKYPLGSLISYETVDGRYSKGGFITKFADKYFIFIMYDFSQKYRVRYINISRIWVGNVNSVTNDIIGFDNITNKTNFPVKVNDVIVKYVKDNHSIKRFICTQKYKITVKWIEMFKKKC